MKEARCFIGVRSVGGGGILTTERDLIFEGGSIEFGQVAHEGGMTVD